MFTAAGQASTKVRVVLTSSAQRLQLSGHNKDFTNSSVAMIGNVQQNAGADQYQAILDLLEKRLASGAPPQGGTP